MLKSRLRSSFTALGALLFLFVAACSRSSGTAGLSASASPAPAGPQCDPAWLAPPAVDRSIAVPPGGGQLVARAAASGTQNYVCQPRADAGGAWNLVGPQASLRTCTGTSAGQHFASDAGAAMPEWQSPDGTYVIASKIAAVTPDGGAGSVPWVLLRAVGHGGTGELSRIAYVQRVATRGGVAPGGPCEAGARKSVPYSADYYFYAP